MNEVLNYILNCTEEELKKYIEKRINNLNKNSEVTSLGFLDEKEISKPYKGFINLETTIKYSNLGLEYYKMRTTDYFYEFCDFIRKNKISKMNAVIDNIETFLNDYFGMPKYDKDARSLVFNDAPWQTTNTDDEFFKKLEDNEIGMLKGKGMALCTERSTVSQNILSFFDIDSYLVVGMIDYKNRCQNHMFNLAKSKNGYVLLDYSMPVNVVNGMDIIGLFPYEKLLNDEDSEKLLSEGGSLVVKTYEYDKIDGKYKKVEIGEEKVYTFGNNKKIFYETYDNNCLNK